MLDVSGKDPGPMQAGRQAGIGEATLRLRAGRQAGRQAGR
jgi:hypothetical protein